MKLKKLFVKILKFPYYRYRKYVARPLNQRHRYDFPAENNGWKKYGNTAVFGNPEIGTMFDPYVFQEDGVFHMVVSSRKTKSLLLVDSQDGACWEKIRVLLNGRIGTWDENVNRGCLIICNGVHYLWYTGQTNGVACIGLATSTDGENFSRVGNAPVLKADLPIEGVSVMNPCVLWDEYESVFKMWYSAGETYEPDVICYAESSDGISWKKWGSPVLRKNKEHEWEKYKVGGCCVLKNTDGTYEIYYIGYQNLDVARICKAHSVDGKNWLRDDNNLLLAPSANSWDSDAVYKPSVIKMKGKFYLWYNGRHAHEEYIGLAVKEI